MPTAATPSTNGTPSSFPFLAMGITFLLLGIGFANPFPLVNALPAGIWEGQISRAALNLYALTVFLGWGHFFYAWQGQWRGASRLAGSRSAAYWTGVALLLLLLLAFRSLLGVAVFSLMTWVYNIAHFVKAETFFAGMRRPGARKGAHYSIPAIAFAWFTLALFQAGPLHHATLVFAGSLMLAVSHYLPETGPRSHPAR